MFANTVARTKGLRTSRTLNLSTLCHRQRYHGVPVSSQIAVPVPLGETQTSLALNNKAEPSCSIHSTSMKRRRGTPFTKPTFRYHHNNGFHRCSFSTTAAPSPDQLPSSATTGNIAGHKSPIPTERDIAMAGGVWAVTSAKRDKLGELKNALPEDRDSLDEMATAEELLDLHLADGIQLITKVTDSGVDADAATNEDDDTTMQVLKEFTGWLESQRSDDPSDEIDRTELGIKLDIVSAKLDSLLETVPSDRCLRNIRDFLDPGDIEEFEDNHINSDNNLSTEAAQFWDSVTRYRLLLAKTAIDHLLESWSILTTVSDADIDRAAAEGIAMEPELDTVSLDKVMKFLQTNVSGSCSDRITAAWNLMDRDEDGSLNESEMHQVVHLCLGIEVDALKRLFQESLEAFPVRAPLSAIAGDDDDTTDSSAAPKKGWRQRRAEKKTKNNLMKMFEKSCKHHFDVEVEVNHRLRCIYAWANKDDQGNQLKSVVVDEQVGWSGRKRYVELSPKISEAEFREVQTIHFKHMNRLGGEIASSFREDLWVLQGKRRERKELVRNSFLFLAAVSAVDYVILML